GLGRRLADLHARGLEGLLLGLRRTRGTGDDGARVAHRLALRGGEARDVPNDRLRDVLGDEVRGPLLGVTADLTDHHDDRRLRVGLERLEGVDVRGADDRVTADTHARREADVTQLVHHLVGQRARLRHEADLAGARDVRRDDAGVRLRRRDDAGAVRADDPRLVALGLGVRPEVGRVVHRDALGDDDGERDLGVDGLDHRVLGELGRHEDDADVGTGLGHRLRHGAEDGEVLLADGHGLTGLAGIDATDDVGAGGEHLGRVLGALGPGDALNDDLAAGIEEDRHVSYAPAASSAALSAALSMVSTCVTSGWLASLRMRRPPSTLLPSRRTTSGLVASSRRIFSASTMPFATASQAGSPAQSVTWRSWTSGTPRMPAVPAAMTAAEAPPTTSRKFAGVTPPRVSAAYVPTARVDITRPGPLPMMPTWP